MGVTSGRTMSTNQVSRGFGACHGQGEGPTKSCVAVFGVVSNGLADLGGGNRTPSDTGELP